MIARRDFAERAAPYLDEGLFSLHGPDAAVHDPVAGREGSFDTVTKAMRLMREVRPDFALFVNTVVTNKNVDALPRHGGARERARRPAPDRLQPHAEGKGLDAYESLAVPLERLKQILPQVPDRAGDTVVRFFGVPMCILGPHCLPVERSPLGPAGHGRVGRQARQGGLRRPLLVGARSQARPRARVRGLHAARRVHGDLRPLRRALLDRRARAPSA